MHKIFPLLLSVLFIHTLATGQVPNYWQPRGIGGGGALFFPTINPANDDEFFVSCDMSELFHSTDFGLSYSQIDFTRLQVFNTSTYEFTNDASIAYSNFNDGNNGYPVKTVNGGATWTPMNAYNLGTYGNVYAMKVNYNNPQQMLIGAYGDILFTNNGGTSFSLVKHAANMGAGLILGGVFWDGNNIYIGTNDGLIYSTNGGTSFSVMPVTGIPAGQVTWSFAGGKASGTKRFVCITANTSGTYNGIMPYNLTNGSFATGVYVMDNADGTWIPKSTGITFSSDFVAYAAMAWNDITTIYLGGKDNALGAPLVYKSTNGGTSWTKKFNTTGNANIITGWQGSGGDKNWSWDEMCFGIAVAPYNSNKVIFGNFGDVQLSSDGGDNWRQAYVSTADQHPAGISTPKYKAYHSIGLENTTCWQVHWQDANKMIGCFSDIGCIQSTDAGASWGFQYTGLSVNSLYRIAKGNDGKMYGGCSNIHDMYQSTRLADAQLDATDGNGKIVYSADSGATWSTLHTFNHPVFWVAIDPNNQNRMYASVIHSTLGGIYKTDNLNSLAASTWTKLSNPPRTEGHPASITVLNDGKMVCTYSGRRNSSGTFTASSGVFIYDPISTTWTDVSDNGMKYWTKDIIIDPKDATQNTWYVCVFSGWGGAPNGLGGLYKTTNRGANWTKLTGSQFDRVTSITFSPNDLNQAFLTTETQGLWVSTDMNAVTPSWNLVTGYPFRQPERVFFNPYNIQEIWVSSFGNGMKVGNVTFTGTSFEEPVTTDEGLTLFPNPASKQVSFQFNNKNTLIKSIEVLDPSGRIIATPKCLDSGSVDIESLASGLYMINIYTDGKVYRGRFIKR